MTQSEWLKVIGTDPMGIVSTIHGAASSRQLRLFVCAVCRHHWKSLKEAKYRAAVELAERYADKLATEAEREGAAAATAFLRKANERTDTPTALANWTVQANDVMLIAAFVATTREPDLQPWQCGILRDLFGNAFGRIALDRSWLNPLVKTLAQGIYVERRYQDLPILADALEEGGCTNADLLAHCREGGPHVRGCWAVDLLLEKR